MLGKKRERNCTSLVGLLLLVTTFLVCNGTIRHYTFKKQKLQLHATFNRLRKMAML